MTNTEIKVNGYRGTWSIVDGHDVIKSYRTLERYALLEHDFYGDETCFLVIKDDERYWTYNIYNGPVYETFDGIETCLEDEGII
jgi:hypothetical protein